MKLTNRQKQTAILAARDAYARLMANGKWQMANGDGAARPLPKFEEWRHEQIHLAVGRAGLTCCTNEHFCRVMAHFEELAGNHDKALDWLMKDQTNGQRQLEAVLLRLLASNGLRITYAATICRSMFKCDLVDANEKQLKRLIMIVKERGNFTEESKESKAA